MFKYIYTYLLISLLSQICHTAEPLIEYASCKESVGRKCSKSNYTDYLLNMKKGGSDVLSTGVYLYDFYLCEEYNYDCGYMETNNSYITISNGVSLNISFVELSKLAKTTALKNKIEPYVREKGSYALCGIRLFPLTLTSAESQEILNTEISRIDTLISTSYESERNKSSTISWGSININIRTAVLYSIQKDETIISSTNEIWSSLIVNNFKEISNELKSQYVEKEQQVLLHSSYLIDSVTQQCHKKQSINFLVDESGSIGAGPFKLALQFLSMYLRDSKDEVPLMSIHFYDTDYDPYLGYNHNKTYFEEKIPIKPYGNGSTYTGLAMNASINTILSAGFSSAIPKILVVMTDGKSQDLVDGAAQRAVNNGIICLAVGIGANVSYPQLEEIAGNPSNIISINSYGDLPKLVEFISNYFCKQIITIKVNETINGNTVIVPESPSYFRVEKSSFIQSQTYILTIYFEENPISNDFVSVESQMDPFPDQYTEFKETEYYDVFTEETSLKSSNLLKSSSFKPKRVYFIKPQHEVNYTVKKNFIDTMNVTVSYVAIGGNNLKFNLTLNDCPTLNCDDERALYKVEVPTPPTPPTPTPPTPTPTPTPSSPDIILIPQSEDLSIFIIIGITLGTLACLCGVCILGVRKILGSEEEETQNGNAIANEATLMPEETGNKIDNQILGGFQEVNQN